MHLKIVSDILSPYILSTPNINSLYLSVYMSNFVTTHDLRKGKYSASVNCSRSIDFNRK